MSHKRQIGLVLCALLCAQAVLPALLWAAELERHFAPCCGEWSQRWQRTVDAAEVGSKAAARQERPTERRRGRRLLMSAAWTLGMGAFAYWGKERANSAYTRYMHSANTLNQQRYFERAERYDRMAGAAFIGMEVGVLFTTYLLFFRR